MHRPTVTGYAEVSADGKTTHRRGSSSKDMMSFEDDDVRYYRHQLRATSDAIMVGSNTIRIDDPSLTARYAPGRNPLRVVPSCDGNIPLESQILNDGGATLIAVGESASD
jgi:5-amino-6-(5-phosphoribosylamino)uracil reductase